MQQVYSFSNFLNTGVFGRGEVAYSQWIHYSFKENKQIYDVWTKATLNNNSSVLTLRFFQFCRSRVGSLFLTAGTKGSISGGFCPDDQQGFLIITLSINKVSPGCQFIGSHVGRQFVTRYFLLLNSGRGKNISKRFYKT